MKSNLRFPIIISVKDGKPTRVLDGNHRVEKAYILNKEKLKCYAVPEEDVIKKFKKQKNSMKHLKDFESMVNETKEKEKWAGDVHIKKR